MYGSLGSAGLMMAAWKHIDPLHVQRTWTASRETGLGVHLETCFSLRLVFTVLFCLHYINIH